MRFVTRSAAAAILVGVALGATACGGGGGSAKPDELPTKLNAAGLSCGPVKPVAADEFSSGTPGLPDSKVECSESDTNAALYLWDSGNIDQAFVKDVLIDRACRFDVDTSYVQGDGWVGSTSTYVAERDVNDVDLVTLQKMKDATGGTIKAPDC